MNFADAYNAMLASAPQPPAGLHGHGIILGLFERGDKAHASVVVTINILRDLLNFRGAIQLWHVGDAPKLCKNFEVEFIDATRVVKNFPGHIRSWCLKSYAIEHSGLARVCWLDWDAYACRNPRPFFDMLDAGLDFYYWSNGRHWDDLVNRKVVESITTNPTPHSVQGGVYFLNCASPAGWKLLQLQRVFDTYERETWGGNYDQDGWLLGVAASECKYVNNDDNPWIWPAWVSKYEGVPYFIHRCGDKLWTDKLGKFNGAVPLDGIVERLYRRILGPRYEALANPPAAPRPQTQAERIEAARRERGLDRPMPRKTGSITTAKAAGKDCGCTKKAKA